VLEAIQMADKTKVRRLFDLYRRFESHARLTVAQIMDDYGVNRRTVNRDLNDLQEIGLDLDSEELPSGRKVWSLAGRSRRIRVPYNLTDLTALFMGRRLFDFLRGTLLEESLDKVYQTIENQLQKTVDFVRARDLRRKVYLVSEGPKELEPDQVEHLDAVLTGLLEQKLLDLEYKNAAGQASALRVAPYTLVAYKRGLYLLARVEESGAMRTFALERIEDASWIRGSSFDLPDDYDPEAHFRDALYISPGEPERVEVVFTATTEPFIRIRRFHHSQRLTKLKDGRIKMTLDVPAGPEAFEIVNWLLSFGANVEVIKPAGLRQRVRDELKRAARQYR
jgi:proteasome accessory factor B